MKLISPAFGHQGYIPKKYTCEGDNISPPLEIQEVPDGVESFALICDDPDAATDPDGPGETFDHWVLFNIDPSNVSFKEGEVPARATHGKNSADKNEYMGPCPPNGTHRYFFHLCALNENLELNKGTSKEEVLAALQGKVVDQAQLIGLYEKNS